MAKSTVESKITLKADDGLVTTTVVDFVSPDQVADLLFRGAAMARYAGVPNDTELVGRDVKSLLIFPFTEL